MKIAVIGGDKRMLFAAKAFCDDGYEVSIAGFDDIMSLCDIRVDDAITAAGWADMVVLPVRPLCDGAINAPFEHDPIMPECLAHEVGEKPVFSGSAGMIKDCFKGRVWDYSVREDFAIRNAVLTAEGALGILMNLYEGALFGAQILILGYGRIGKVLARDLNALGAKVTVVARNPTDRLWAGTIGCCASAYSDLELYKFDIVINTVPAKVMDAAFLDGLDENVFIIDLASVPGGADRQRLHERDLTYHHALALPSKTAPLAAGRIIKETIINMIKEEIGGKDNTGLCADGFLLHL